MKSTPILSTLLFTLVTLVLLGGCSSQVQDRPTASRGVPSDFQPLLALNDLEPQVFQVDPDKENTFLGKKGTIVRVPADAFASTSTAPIELELVEAPELDDLILLNAQTLSNGELLETDGVVLLQKTQNGQELQLKAGKNVEIKIPTNRIDPQMTAFTGEFDEGGNLNWVRNNQMDFDTASTYNELVTKGMFEIPFSLFPYMEEYQRMDSIAKKYPERNGKVFAPSRSLLISKEKANFYKKIISIIESEQYKGTYLATREFAERLYRLQYVDHTYSWEEPKANGLFELAHDKFAPIQHRVVKIYIDHIEDPLWVADSLAYQQIRAYKPDWHANRQQLEAYRKRCARQLQYFEEFKSEKLTQVITIEDEGVDLSDQGAFEELLNKGLEPETALQRIRLYERQQLAIEELHKDNAAFVQSMRIRDRIMQQQREAEILNYYFITANQLGWINVDRFYNAPNAAPIKLFANIESEIPLSDLTVSLVFREQSSFLSGYKEGKRRYRFTHDEETYSQLPVGAKASIVAISVKNETPYLGITPIIIGDREEVTVEVKAMLRKEFQQQLEGLN